MGVAATDALTWPDDVGALTSAIIHHENGQNPYPDTVLTAGLNMATGTANV